MFVFIFLSILSGCSAGPATESYKDQYCTDPRTMRKHAAYTEWADAYSCSRHRCQPGGRNLAIYTVGCKRVEAPESAIECEEVVEDTNMQFPYCCTRLRCLVVVRGEVWTRVLGQPWEALPAAPWSHMYKMKKPPPTDGTFLPKNPNEGPIYELQTENDHQEIREKILRVSKKIADDYNEAAPRAAATPDIVIALSTANDQKEHKMESSGSRHKHSRKNFNSRYLETTTADPDENDVAPHAPVPDIVFALSTNNDQKEHTKVENDRHTHTRKNSANSGPFFEEEQIREEGHETHDEMEDATIATEKTPSEQASDERYMSNAFGVTHKVSTKSPPHSWTEIPLNQWNERDPSMDAENPDHSYHGEAPEAEKKDEKPGNLQALVDAIGTRMRDIESVVQRMSDKVRVKPTIQPELDLASGEKSYRNQDPDASIHKHRNEKEHPKGKPKKSSADSEHYKRFSVRNHGSKYLHSATDSTTDQPLFVEDSNLNGYYSDASNSVVRRYNSPKEPPPTYMAPVETRRKTSHSAPEGSDEVEKKRKKHVHKKKRSKGHHKKHRGKDEKRKRFNRLNSVEVDKNVGSLEDSSVAASNIMVEK